jgi:hypothetical protein
MGQNLEDRLPRGNISLNQKVKAMYWTPFRDGLSVLFESFSDN